ncbi:MAG TPA: pyrroloquinoline quinone precursor peptide PqqA [Marmoricola sp.]
MERTDDKTRRSWESPTVAQIRVSAEVTAYVATWDEAD